MAKAVPPSTIRRTAEADRTAAAVKRITVVHLVSEDETYRLAAQNLPIDQRAVVLRQIGVSFDALMASGDEVLACAAIVWLARRTHGEPSLSWAQFLRQWPDDLRPGDIDLWAENPQGQRIDPEGNVIPEHDLTVADALDVGEVDADVEDAGDEDPEG